MAPPGNSADPKSAKKGKKSSSKDERKHRKDKHERPTAAPADEAPLRSSEAKRKHKGGKEHGKKPKKAEAETEATGAGEAKRGQDKMKRAMEDDRFAVARTDPRFRPMRRKEAKVTLDSRFDGMLTNPMFASSEAPVDKRGRRRKKSARENPMLHYYLNQEEGDPKKEKKEKEKLIREEEDDDEPEEEDGQDEEESSSSDDDEEEDDDDNDDQYSIGSDIAHYLMARHDDTPTIDKETHRLAVVNMDWDHIKAVDLYMVMTSCVPKGGRVLSVSIYPSEFGLECMNIETTQGPSALIGADEDEDEDDGGDGGEDDNDDDEDDDGGAGGEDDNDDDEDDDSDDVGGEEDSEHDSETENNRLRAYELNKLRYYYAVVVCDSSATANHLYTTLDGTEFLKTANVFDLQFIPDSMEFKRAARDVATEAPPSYKEPDFETRALQHSKVNPTWDDDEPDRKKILRRKFKEDQLDDLGIFLASDDSSSDDDSGDESLRNGVAKRKLTNKERLALLLEGDKSDEEQNDDQDMEITFNTELEDLSKRILERKSTEKKTVWEMHQEKMKEKRKARKRSSKDDDESSDEDSADEKDDFFEDEKSDEDVQPIKKQKVKAKGKGKANLPKEEHFEPEATKEELELLVAADQDAANGAKGYNIKRKSKKGKKGKDSVEDKLPEIDLSTDPRFSQMFTSHLYAMDPTDPQYKRSATFVRKQVGKKSARAGTLDTEPPVEEPSVGNTLPPDDASSKNAKRNSDGASKDKLQMMSAVNSLKRNLTAFKKASKSDR